MNGEKESKESVLSAPLDDEDIYIYIYIYILPYPSKVEFSGEEVIVLPLAYIASLFIYELRSR